MIAFETLPCLKEAQAIAHLLRTELPGRPAWLTFNCRDEAPAVERRGLCQGGCAPGVQGKPPVPCSLFAVQTLGRLSPCQGGYAPGV